MAVGMSMVMLERGLVGIEMRYGMMVVAEIRIWEVVGTWIGKFGMNRTSHVDNDCQIWVYVNVQNKQGSTAILVNDWLSVYSLFRTVYLASPGMPAKTPSVENI